MNVAKVGDSVVGICGCSSPPYPDVGTIVSGFPGLLEAGQPVATTGSMVIFSCGASTVVSGTAGEVTSSGLVSRSGDTATGCGNGTIVASSPDTST